MEPKKILIVDDSEERGPAFREVLEISGHTADLEITSQGALRIIAGKANEQYDFVFMDRCLGAESELNGIETTREITIKYPGIKVIVYTGQDQNRDIINEALQNGAYRYMFSPFEVQEAIEIMECAENAEELKKQLEDISNMSLLLKCILKDSEIGISVVDRKYRLLYMNEKQVKLNKGNDKSNNNMCYGGLCWVEFYNGVEQAHSCSWCPVRKCFEEKEMHSNVTVAVQNGSIHYYELFAMPVWNVEHTKIIGAVKMTRDVTGQEVLFKKLLESGDKNKRLGAVLDSILGLGYKRVRLYEVALYKYFIKGVLQKTVRLKDKKEKIELEEESEEVFFKTFSPLEGFENLMFLVSDYDSPGSLTGEPILLDISNPEISREIKDKYDVDEWIAVPIQNNGELLGYIEADNGSREENSEKLSVNDPVKLKALAQYAGKIILEAREKERIQKEAEQLERLRQMDLELSKTEDMTKSFDTIVKYAKELTGALSLHIRHKEGEKLVKKSGCGVYADITENERDIANQASGSVIAFQKRKPHIITDANEEFENVSLHIAGFIKNHKMNKERKRELESINAIGTFPLIADDQRDCRAVGTICFQSERRDFFSPEMTQLIMDFCQRAAALICTHELLEEKETALKQIKVAVEARNDLYHKITHSLKLPLHSLEGFTQRLIEGKYSSEEQRKKEMQIVGRQLRHFRVNVENMLNLVGGEAKSIKPAYKELDIVSIASETMGIFRPMAEKKGIKMNLEFDEPQISVMADEHMIEDILHNLISNAINYTLPDSGGKITVSFDKQGRHIFIRVKDTGVGIPENQKEKIFEKLYRLQCADALSPSGSGIGLTVCRVLVELHQGKIWVESEPGNGSCFTVEIPEKPLIVDQ